MHFLDIWFLDREFYIWFFALERSVDTEPKKEIDSEYIIIIINAFYALFKHEIVGFKISCDCCGEIWTLQSCPTVCQTW